MIMIPKRLQEFDFFRLFNELGWEQLTVGLEKEVCGLIYALQPIAHKRGVQVLECLPGPDGEIPPYSIRQKIERKVTSDVREHLIIFSDAAHTRQIWQWVARAPGRPTQYREVKWQQGQPTELLEQKLRAVSFDLDEEESLTVFGVAERLRGGFDRDIVTKRFYKIFQAQREAFQRFIEGIPADDHARWYTAVVIDRLMFLWFLQEKGFLDNEKRYLRNRLDAHLAAMPSASFYKAFLCPLFLRGFAEERTETNRAVIVSEFGNVPYLNGGLFTEHELEREYGDAIDIPDTAFVSLFAFFDEWDWHLDDRPLRSGKEINPDVLGYIFEKFVNQKQMGAYYTKEDITEYIAKNTIIPCLLEKVRADHVAAFDAHVWPLLQEDPRRYLYPAMLHGVDEAYPPEIAIGLDTEEPNLLERRKEWNKRAEPNHALTTEIWRETIARHHRTREIFAKLEAGEVRTVADLITYNLNIRQFAQDVIERCANPALLRSFWVALAGRLPGKSNEKYRHGLSVLDPTCGSGAFLFAALQILNPLYQACLTAMSGLLADEAIQGRPLGEKWKDIESIVGRFQAQETDRVRDYAVLKHIIVHNLYGVDIEAQATEIAKLRLFLKLVALLEPGDDIEPLPDIDFNIRAGNTLVGYASAAETERAVMGAEQQNLFTSAWDDIRVRLTAVEQSYNNFQLQQVQRGGHVTAEDKRALRDQLDELEETLNQHLCREYGKNPKKAKEYKAWRDKHKPFHWYVDFYRIMAAGGFDVVIGNPPYIQLSEIYDYSFRGYSCVSCGNLYGVMLERTSKIIEASGRQGFIVPVSSISTDGYSSVQALYTKSTLYVSCFDDRPSRLFDGLEHIRLVIILARKAETTNWLSTRYHKWTSVQRPQLFQKLSYFPVQDRLVPNSIPKLSDHVEHSILEKIALHGQPLSKFAITAGTNALNFSRKVGYFLQVVDFTPRVIDSNGSIRDPSEFKRLAFTSTAVRDTALATLNSSLFYWFITVFSDCRHLNKREVELAPLATSLLESPSEPERLRYLCGTLMERLQDTAEVRIMKFKHDTLSIQCLIPKKAKDVIDKIDLYLAEALLLSPEELDYIINYDIKYRMGLNGGETDSDD